jgi:hypothetical protein
MKKIEEIKKIAATQIENMQQISYNNLTEWIELEIKDAIIKGDNSVTITIIPNISSNSTLYALLNPDLRTKIIYELNADGYKTDYQEHTIVSGFLGKRKCSVNNYLTISWE